MTGVSGIREAREAAARKWLVGHYAAIVNGPGIPQAVISDLADFAERDSVAALLVDACAERDRLRELLNEAKIADPAAPPTIEGVPTETVSGPMTAGELEAYNARKTGKPAPVRPAPRRRPAPKGGA